MLLVHAVTDCLEESGEEGSKAYLGCVENTFDSVKDSLSKFAQKVKDRVSAVTSAASRRPAGSWTLSGLLAAASLPVLAPWFL